MKHSSGVFNPRESVRVSSDAGCGARKVGGGGREGRKGFLESGKCFVLSRGKTEHGIVRTLQLGQATVEGCPWRNGKGRRGAWVKL